MDGFSIKFQGSIITQNIDGGSMNPASHTIATKNQKARLFKSMIKWELVRVGIFAIWMAISAIASLSTGLTFFWIVRGFPDPVSSATGLGITIITLYFYVKMFFVMHYHYKQRPTASDSLHLK